jgi:hypothetical protein
MKRSKPTSSSRSSRKSPSLLKKPDLFLADSQRALKALQRRMADAVMRPLTPRATMQKTWTDGRPTRDIAAEFIKPNDRVSSFERLEIYNKQYWFRLIDSFYDDYPGLLAVLGEKKFVTLAEKYIERHPSASFTLRDLGSRLEKFMRENPRLTAPHQRLALDMARFEWAQVEAFDNEAHPILTEDDLHGREPSALKLKLQPYVMLLELEYPVDDFLIAVKRGGSMRGETSNTIELDRKTRVEKKRSLPKPKKTWLAVHRVDNDLYYKKIEPEAFGILTNLRKGLTLEKACAKALEKTFDANVNWPGKIQEWFANWTSLGWFSK